MYTRFKEILAKKSRSEMRKFVESNSADKLSKMLTERICDAEAPRILEELLQGFPDSKEEEVQTKRRKIVEAVLTTLQKTSVTSAHVDSVVNCITSTLPQYTKPHLVKLVEFCHDRIRLNDDDFMSWKDILPLILEVLEEQKYINHKGNEVSGLEYKSLIVKSICNNSWDSEILTSLAKMFGEMTLGKEDHELVIRALCDKLQDVALNEIPPLVHQLLRLCTNQNSRLLLGTLQKYFAAKYAESNESQTVESIDMIGVVSLTEIQETESTVLYHIYKDAQLDHTSLKEFVSSLKKLIHTPEAILDPFLMAVLLSVYNIYESQIFEILKQAMCRKIQDDEKRKNSIWLRTVLSDDWRIVDVVEQVIVNSNKDRHLVLNGLVEFAFVLMDNDNRAKNDEQHLYEIGTRILQKLIRKRHEIGPTVLRKLTETIVSCGSQITQYTECLSYLCRKMTLIVLDSQVWVVTLLEQLMSIPGDAAKQVLHAILPLMRISATIRDNLVLILRKALYRKGTYTRQMAVIGFLHLLKNLKINDLNALSQSGQSSGTGTSSSTSIFTQVTLERRTQSTKLNARCNAILCHELLNILKRCFTHEIDVRVHLYKGLYDAVLMNPELSEYVMEMLMAHFNIYYENDLDVKPPLRFDICSDIHGPEAVLQEPIGDLIFVMQRIYVKMASSNSPLLDKVSVILESLCKRITQTELEHLNIDDRTDLLDNVPKSQQKLQALKLMISVHEALMAYRIGGWSNESVNVAQSINSLFKSYSELVDFSKRVPKSKKGEGKRKKGKDANDTTVNKKGPRASGVKLPNSIMDLDTIHKILCVLYAPSVPWSTKEQASFLKKRPEFHQYILQTAIQVIQNAKTLKNIDLRAHQDLHIKDYLDIGELLYKEIVSELDRIRAFDQLTGVLGLECFKALCDLMCSSFTSELPKFLSRICGIEAARGLPAQTEALLKTLQSLVVSYFEEEKDDEVVPKKIPVILLETMSILLHKVSFEDVNITKIFEWWKKFARTTEVETPIAVIFVELLSFLEERYIENGNTTDELCIELCGKLGTNDKNDVTIEENYKCLTESSAVQAHGILSATIKYKLNNVSWLLGRLKAEQFIISSSSLSNESDRDKLRRKERSLCCQLSYIIQTLQSLTTAAIKPGPNTDLTFRNLHQLYKLIGELTKYFYNKSTAQNPAFQSVKFIQLVELAGKSLKSAFYNLAVHTEESQNHAKGKIDSYTRRNKVIKETKDIPNVVWAIESFQKEIMQLSKKTGIPLENYLKQSIARDYRIKNSQLVEGLEKLDVSLQITQQSLRASTPHPDETESRDDGSDSSDDAPPAKTPRLDDSA